MRIPSEVKISSKPVTTVVSRSRRRNVNEAARSSRSMARLHPTWVTHTPGRVRGDAEQVYPPSTDYDHEEDVEALVGQRCRR
jgi:hypothetical protein